MQTDLADLPPTEEKMASQSGMHAAATMSAMAVSVQIKKKCQLVSLREKILATSRSTRLVRTVLRSTPGSLGDADAGRVTCFFRTGVNQSSINVLAEIAGVALEVQETAAKRVVGSAFSWRTHAGERFIRDVRSETVKKSHLHRAVVLGA